MDKLDKASKRLEQMANQAEQNAAGAEPSADDDAKVRAIATDNLKALLPASLPGGMTAPTSPRPRPARRASSSAMPPPSMPRPMRVSRCR
jgi:hypothetical protein